MKPLAQGQSVTPGFQGGCRELYEMIDAGKF
jgi:hypothetical protein